MNFYSCVLWVKRHGETRAVFWTLTLRGSCRVWCVVSRSPRRASSRPPRSTSTDTGWASLLEPDAGSDASVSAAAEPSMRSQIREFPAETEIMMRYCQNRQIKSKVNVSVVRSGSIHSAFLCYVCGHSMHLIAPQMFWPWKSIRFKI